MVHGGERLVTLAAATAATAAVAAIAAIAVAGIAAAAVAAVAVAVSVVGGGPPLPALLRLELCFGLRLSGARGEARLRAGGGLGGERRLRDGQRGKHQRWGER